MCGRNINELGNGHCIEYFISFIYFNGRYVSYFRIGIRVEETIVDYNGQMSGQQRVKANRGKHKRNRVLVRLFF